MSEQNPAEDTTPAQPDAAAADGDAAAPAAADNPKTPAPEEKPQTPAPAEKPKTPAPEEKAKTPAPDEKPKTPAAASPERPQTAKSGKPSQVSRQQSPRAVASRASQKSMKPADSKAETPRSTRGRSTTSAKSQNSTAAKTPAPVSREVTEIVGGVPDQLPDGCEPLFLSSKTQEMFGLRADVDVNKEKPLKLVTKNAIIDDMRRRAAISDWSVVKQLVLNFPGDELLVMYDYDFKFGQNFILAATEGAKEAILHPPQPEVVGEEEEEVSYQYVPPVSKPWISYGSEREIAQERLVTMRKTISMQVRRPRKEFGSTVTFRDRNVADAKDGYLEVQPYEEKGYDLKKMEQTRAVDAVPQFANTGTQTTWKYPKNQWTQYQVREFDEATKLEIAGTEEFKEFMVGSLPFFEAFLQQNEVCNLYADDWALLSDSDMIGGRSDTHLKEYQSFTDLEFSKDRQVTWVEWHPTIKGVVAVAVAERIGLDERIDNSAKIIMKPSMVLIWSFSDPIHPQLILIAPEDVLCFAFCPTNPNIVAGGCINGTVIMWDITEHADRLKSARSTKKKQSNYLPGFEDPSLSEIPRSRYCAVSNIEYSHRSAITDILWIPDHYEVNKMGIPLENKSLQCVQIMTAAADNTVLVWDIRPQKGAPTLERMKETALPMGVPTTFKHLDLTWRPFLRIHLFKSEPGGDHNPTKFTIYEKQGDRSILNVAQEVYKEKDFSNTQTGQFHAGRAVQEARSLQNLKTHIFVGTEDGEIAYVDWLQSKDQDTGKIQTQKPVFYDSLHDGPIVSLERSPFFRDVVLCVGGSGFSVWREGTNTGPLWMSKSYPKRLSGGCFSPTRPAVFYITAVDGTVDVWDLIDRSHEPSITQSLMASPITCIKPYQVSAKQQLLAVGDYDGTLHIIEVPSGLRQPAANEQQLIVKSMDREVKRRAFVKARWDIREQEQIEKEAEAKRKAGIAPAAMLSEEEVEMKMKLEYQVFLEEQTSFFRQLGIDIEDKPGKAQPAAH